jgi:hypothetical protein
MMTFVVILIKSSLLVGCKLWRAIEKQEEFQ